MSRLDPARPDQHGSVERLLRSSCMLLSLLFVMRVLASLPPLRAGAASVALRLCDALVAQAPVAVLVVCLLGLLLLHAPEASANRRLARRLRNAALPVAIGYLLLIPLFGTSRWWHSGLEATARREGLLVSQQQLQQARHQVLLARSDAELQATLRALPAGLPPLARLGPDLPRRRAALLGVLKQVHDMLSLRLQSLEQQRQLRDGRDAVLFALACLGLAGLFYRSSQLDLPSAQRPRPRCHGRLPSRWGSRQPHAPGDALTQRLWQCGAGDPAETAEHPGSPPTAPPTQPTSEHEPAQAAEPRAEQPR